MANNMKVIESETAEDFEKKINQFAMNNNVFATQTHYDMSSGMTGRYMEKFVAVMFYKE